MWLKVHFGFSFGVRAQMEVKIWCIKVKGMYMLKYIVSSGVNVFIKSLYVTLQ